MIFSGEYEHRIDSQGRIAIPVRFRAAFADGVVLARGYDACITAYPITEWNRLSESLNSLQGTSADARRLFRVTFGGAYPTELDRQGRVLVPAGLRQYAGIGDAVITVGTGRYLEIWSAERWTAERDALDEQAAEIAERTSRSAGGSQAN